MSESRFTPGPWKWFTSNSHNRLSSVASGKDGDVLYAYKDSTGFPHLGCNKQDMALIVAAPELLEALQAVLRVADRATDEFDMARAAIAKALG